MKIVVISDSHGSIDRLETVLQRATEAGIEHVIHAGDFAEYGAEEVLSRYPHINIYLAQGNADVNEEVKGKVRRLRHCSLEVVHSITFENVHIGVSHVEGVAQGLLKNKPRVFIHGHTHRPKREMQQGKLILNPGSLMMDGLLYILDIPTLRVEEKHFHLPYL